MKMPAIIAQQVSSDEIILELGISKELEAFKGHFDSTPIIPGVVQIEWVVTLAKELFDLQGKDTVSQMSALKFQNVIQPGDKVELKINLSADKLIFSFNSTDRKHSSGKLFLS